MKYLLLCLTFVALLSCNQAPSGGGQNAAKNQKYLTFTYSKDVATMDVRDPGNWCNANFGEAALINADPKNYHRRLFALSDVPTRIAVDFGHLSAFFMLYLRGEQVEIYTSDNLPACLSNKTYFQINPEGTAFRYDNKKDISFDVYLQELPSGVQIALDLPTTGGHGLSVVRCEGCK